MTSTTEQAEPMAELTRLLETWGATPARWPPHVRLRIEQLSTAGAEASAALAEALALDCVLDRVGDAPATLSPAKASALADRIVMAALAEETVRPVAPSAIGATAQVIQLSTRPRVPYAAPAGRRWQAAALMAASLLAGLYLGGNLNLAPVFQELADAIGLSTLIDPTQIALGEDLSDEDAL